MKLIMRYVFAAFLIILSSNAQAHWKEQTQSLHKIQNWSQSLNKKVLEAALLCELTDNGSFEISPDAVQKIDLNNDGKLDEILNMGAFRCSTSYTLWSTSGGSWRVLIVNETVTKFLAKSLAVTYPFGDYPIVTMLVHGSQCGQPGVVDCVVSTVWSHGKFQVLKFD